MNHIPKVSIIIANYNGEQYLEVCLHSVLNSTFNDFEILLIDDGSTDESIQIIKKFQKIDKRIHLLKNKKNLGAAASRNRGIAVAKGDIIIFLDNDTEVEKSWIYEMMRLLESNNDIGACQAKLLDYKRRSYIQNAGVNLWAQTAWGLSFWQWERNGIKHKTVKEIIAISAALAVKKEVLDIVGGFDEAEAVVTEDLDFSWRVWLVGYKVLLCPTAIVYHWTKSVDMRKNMHHTHRKIYFHLAKNSLISIIKNYQLLNAIKYSCVSFVISLGRGVLVLIRRRDLSALLGTFDAIRWVAFHIPEIYIKRRNMQSKRTVTDRELFSKIIIQKSPLIVYNQHYKETNLL
jgi:GT2 family glycosyltransferase